MKNSLQHYNVGALLYTPATNKKIINSLKSENFAKPFSLSFCLEDTIHDDFVEIAENQLIDTLASIKKEKLQYDFYMPNIFVRIRNPKQLEELYTKLEPFSDILTGFIFPKISTQNVDEYVQIVLEVNKNSAKKFYIMPIIEDSSIVYLDKRIDTLHTLKNSLSKIEEYILNIRVGGNDLCNVFGIRRKSDETIYDILPIANILSDIVTVFGKDYVISAPVWEYYDGENWDKGLQNEIKRDILCGFTGKTVIHPKQIEIVNNAYKVSKKDYEDAKNIVGWDRENLVSSSFQKERMNEYKVHYNWAINTLYLAQIYGIKEEFNE